MTFETNLPGIFAGGDLVTGPGIAIDESTAATLDDVIAEVARLAAVYSAAFSLQDIVLPEMQDLAKRTQESAAIGGGPDAEDTEWGRGEDSDETRK